MPKNKVTSELLSILDKHPQLRFDKNEMEKSEWLKEEIARQTWCEPIDSKSVLERLEDLLADFQGISTASIDDMELDRDLIEAEIFPIEIIAYYKSFRNTSRLSISSNWGIYINLFEFFSFNRRIAKITGTSESETLVHVWRFIHQHEINHYEVDLAVLLFEITSNQTFYKMHSSIPEEEGLGNGRGVMESKIKEPWKTAIINRYDWGHLIGYRDVKKYLSPKARREGFESVIEKYLGLQPGTLPPYVHSLMNPKSKFKSKDVPITLVNNIWNSPGSTAAVFGAMSDRSTFTILTISESTKAQKRYEKLRKRDPQMAKQYKKKIEQYVEIPNLPGHQIRAFQGEQNMIEARVDRGFRVLMRDLGGGNWEVEDLGSDIYPH